MLDLHFKISFFSGAFISTVFVLIYSFFFLVQLLLDRGADVNQKDGIGNTPLHLGKIPILEMAH